MKKKIRKAAPIVAALVIAAAVFGVYIYLCTVMAASGAGSMSAVGKPGHAVIAAAVAVLCGLFVFIGRRLKERSGERRHEGKQ